MGKNRQRDAAARALALRTLERKGLIEMRMCPDGVVRWFITEKGKHVRPDDVEVPEERLN